MNPKSSFWLLWLIAVTIAVLLSGLCLIMLPAQTQRVLNWLYFSTSGAHLTFGPAAVAYIEFICAVLGSVMVGWAAVLIMILLGPFRRGQREGWNMLAISLLAWFLPDTTVSLVTGFWPNAVLNLALLVLFAIPLCFTYRAFHSSGISKEDLPRYD